MFVINKSKPAFSVFPKLFKLFQIPLPTNSLMDDKETSLLNYRKFIRDIFNFNANKKQIKYNSEEKSENFVSILTNKILEKGGVYPLLEISKNLYMVDIPGIFPKHWCGWCLGICPFTPSEESETQETGKTRKRILEPEQIAVRDRSSERYQVGG